MQYYINKDIFEGAGQKEEEGIWILVGQPSSDLVGLNEFDYAPSGEPKDCFINNDKGIIIKDICLAGFAKTNDKIKVGYSEGSTNNNSVKITFPSSVASNVMFSRNPSSNYVQLGINPLCLAYVTLKVNDEDKKPFFNTENLTEAAIGVESELWDGFSLRTTEAETGVSTDSSTIWNNFFEKTLLVYRIENFSSGNPVNGYNFTGFSVNSAVINLSGLNNLFENFA